MKILQVGKYYPPFQGGMETVLENLCTGLQKRDHAVSVLCSHHGMRTLEETMDGVSVKRLATYGRLFSQPLTPSFVFELQRSLKTYDLIHLHSPNPLAEWITAMIPAQLPILTTYHSDIVRQKTVSRLYLPMLRRFLRKSSRIIVGSHPAVEYSPVLPEFSGKCRVIPFGIDGKLFAATSEVLSKAEKLRERYGEHLLFVGRLVSYKGIDVLLRSMRQVSQNLLIVGKGPLQTELEQLAQELGVGEKVHFLTEVNDHVDLVAHYHASSLFVLPSITRAEAFGMVMIEAMACGVPIISTQLESGVRFVNAHEQSGLQVPPGNPKLLAEAIQRVFEDKDLHQKLAEGARARFADFFAKDRMIRAHIDLYQEVLAEG